MDSRFQKGIAYRLDVVRLLAMEFQVSDLANGPKDEQRKTGRDLVELVRSGRATFKQGGIGNFSIDEQAAFIIGDETSAAAALLSALFIDDHRYAMWPYERVEAVRDVVLAGGGAFFYLSHEHGQLNDEPAFYNRYHFLLVVPVGEDDELCRRQLRVRWTCVQSDPLRRYFEPWEADATSASERPNASVIAHHRAFFGAGPAGQERAVEAALDFSKATAALPDEFFHAAPSRDAIVLASMMRHQFAEQTEKQERRNADRFLALQRSIGSMRLGLFLLAVVTAILAWRTR